MTFSCLWMQQRARLPDMLLTVADFRHRVRDELGPDETGDALPAEIGITV